MKKLVISALCGLCLFGAFVCASGSAQTGNEEVALSTRRLPVRL